MGDSLRLRRLSPRLALRARLLSREISPLRFALAAIMTMVPSLLRADDDTPGLVPENAQKRRLAADVSFPQA